MIREIFCGFFGSILVACPALIISETNNKNKIEDLNYSHSIVVEELQNQLNDVQTELVSVNLLLAQKSVDLDNKIVLIEEKEARISELQEALNNSISSEDVAVLQEQITSLQNEVNNLTEDKSELLILIAELQSTIDELELSLYTPASYFNIEDGVINGFSSEGRALYDSGNLTELNIPKAYSLGEEKEYSFEKKFNSMTGVLEYLCSNAVEYPITVTDTSGNSASFDSFGAFDSSFRNMESWSEPTVRSTYKVTAVIPGMDYEITAISDTAFHDLVKLKKVKISKNITEIGRGAFMCCTALEEFNIPEGDLLTIGYSAFSECENLKSIYIPSGVTSIDSTAFICCGSLDSIVVSENNLVYDSRNGCNALIETATNILIRGCSNTVIPEGIVEIGVNAFDFSNITSLTIPNSVTKINDKAFYFCGNLTEIILSENLTYIGSYAFQCSGLTSITIPSKVTTISSLAFSSCEKLTTVTILNSVPPVLKYDIFSDEVTAIYVPANSVESYKTAQYWSNYASKIFAISD